MVSDYIVRFIAGGGYNVCDSLSGHVARPDRHLMLRMSRISMQSDLRSLLICIRPICAPPELIELFGYCNTES